LLLSLLRLGLALGGAALTLAASASSLAPGEAPPERTPDIVGEALDPETGEPLYLEHYYCSDDALRCSVFYIRPNREVIASKQLNYEPSLQAPELIFRDFRNNRQLTISPPDDELVVDAGFDNFVRLQWQDLAEGEEVTFPFRMVGREDPIAMRANRSGNCDSGKLCLQIRLDSWLLGKLLDPIQLTYDERSQRLLRFTGISNLKNDQGRSQKVDIRYRYLEGAPAASETVATGESDGGSQGGSAGDG
jgi:hypothetical protein